MKVINDPLLLDYPANYPAESGCMVLVGQGGGGERGWGSCDRQISSSGIPITTIIRVCLSAGKCWQGSDVNIPKLTRSDNLWSISILTLHHNEGQHTGLQQRGGSLMTFRDIQPTSLC